MYCHVCACTCSSNQSLAASVKASTPTIELPSRYTLTSTMVSNAFVTRFGCAAAIISGEPHSPDAPDGALAGVHRVDNGLRAFTVSFKAESDIEALEVARRTEQAGFASNALA